MNARYLMALAALALVSLAVVPFAFTQGGPPTMSAFIKTWDSGKNGTLDLNEVKMAASARFKAFDADKDGKLTRQDVNAILTDADFDKANPDNDTTLEENEYLVLVQQHFTAADANKDGAVDAKELSSEGQAVMEFLQ